MPKDKDTQDIKTPEISKKEENEEEISFTEEQQKKVNELISLRLERVDEKWEAKLKEVQEKARQEIDIAKEEGEKMAKLSAEEREKEVLEQQRKANEERDKLLSQRENKLEAIDIFSEAGVPIELVDYVIDVDKEQTLKNADVFIKNYQSSLEKSVAKKLEGEPPKDIDHNKQTSKPGLKSAY